MLTSTYSSIAWFLLLSYALLFTNGGGTASGAVIERTLAMIKPDGVRANHTDAIKGMIRTEGFRIVAEKEADLDETAARSFYQEHSERSFFPQLIRFITSGPVLALLLEKQNAVKDWRIMMGPTDSHKARLESPASVRSKFGVDGQSNCVHGSDSHDAAAREIAFFFDNMPSGEATEQLAKIHDEL